MRYLSSITPLTLATLGTICIFNACSQTGDRLKITEQKPTSFQKDVGACADSLSPAEKHTITKGKKALCEYPVDSATGAVGANLTPVKNGVSYSVEPSSDAQGRRTNRVNFKHVIELQSLTKALTTADTKDLKALEVAVNNDCKADIESIFSRSRAGVSMSLGLTIQVADADTTVASSADDTSLVAADATPDQTLYVAKGLDGADAVWSLVQVPTQPKFYPLAKSADKQSCIGQGTTPAQQRDCINKKRKPLTRPFCAALAKRVGNIMGIVDTDHEKQLCGAQPIADEPAVTATATPVPKPVVLTPKSVNALFPQPGSVADATATAGKQPPTNEGDSSFAKPTVGDDEYLSKSTLNRKDVVTILSPACPNLNPE